MTSSVFYLSLVRFDVVVRDDLPAGIGSKGRGGRTFWVRSLGTKEAYYSTGTITLSRNGKPLRCEFKVQDGCGITKMHEGMDGLPSRSSSGLVVSAFWILVVLALPGARNFGFHTLGTWTQLFDAVMY